MDESIAILVIDDDPHVLRMLQRVLASAGFAVTTSTTPFGSTKLAAELLPALIIVDHEMPALKGPSLIEVMRRHPACQSIPVLLYSAADPSLLAAAVERGAVDDYLSKGEPLETLIARVRTLVERGRLRNETSVETTGDTSAQKPGQS